MSAIPVIDVGTDERSVTAEIDDACRSVGFFQIVGHGVDPSVMAETWQLGRRFFDLPLVDRLAAARPFAGHPYGYVPVAGEALARSTGQRGAPDDKEVFNIGPRESPLPHPTDPDERLLFAATPWPPALPELRAAVNDYLGQMDLLSARLLRLFALGLGLRRDHLLDRSRRSPSSMRLLNYPARQSPADPEHSSPRAGAHTDYGTFTILWPCDGVGGLEVLDRSGSSWVPVTAVADGFVVNVGDMLERWTNERWRSTAHRVVDTGACSPRRQSIAFFHNLDFDCEVRCLPTCLAPGETPRHEPVRAGPHLMSKFRSTVEA